jgi:endogenous inhibitor of DNA gyrase (YacG/DUF329 family)
MHYIALMSDQTTTTRRCPICGKPADPKTRPFCSRRCADVDLHRWLSGVYAVPAVESEEDIDEGAGEGSER